MSVTQRTLALLGLPGGENGMRAHSCIQRGFPVETIAVFTAAYGMSDKDLARLLGVQPRTLQRRRHSHSPLSAVQSDRLFRIAKVFVTSERVLGERKRARLWLSRPNQALGGVAPESLLDTEAGTQQVLDTLGRIEHGIFA